jgi:hypothetical protein
MADTYYWDYQYKLRYGAPMPVSIGGFKLHTFMAEKSIVRSYTCTENLPGSEEFRGQGGTENGGLISASFSRLEVAGGAYFQGKKVFAPEYIEEDTDLNFNL